MDFINNLDTDTSVTILSCLDDPSDLVRASAVSRSWREFVIKYSLSKNLCVKLFNRLSDVDHILETSEEESSESASSSNLMETKLLEREHRAYALLARGCTLSPIESIIAVAIVASSTDNPPDESILNTLEERDRVGPRQTPSYWSSKGQLKTSVPETLLYKLKGDLCVVTEINVQPFQAYFQRGSPIYSSHYIRFRLGHHNWENSDADSFESNYVWTYTSQEFPMAQENRLQSFKLPEPVVCVGGYMLLEFLGRVQTQEMDGLYYICVAHVKVMGRSLEKSVRVMNPKDSGRFDLKVLSYNDPKEMDNEMEAEAEEVGEASQVPFRPMRNLEQILNFLHRHPLDVEYVWPESDNEEDAESDDDDVDY